MCPCPKKPVPPSLFLFFVPSFFFGEQSDPKLSPSSYCMSHHQQHTSFSPRHHHRVVMQQRGNPNPLCPASPSTFFASTQDALTLTMAFGFSFRLLLLLIRIKNQKSKPVKTQKAIDPPKQVCFFIMTCFTAVEEIATPHDCGRPQRLPPL